VLNSFVSSVGCSATIHDEDGNGKQSSNIFGSFVKTLKKSINIGADSSDFSDESDGESEVSEQSER